MNKMIKNKYVQSALVALALVATPAIASAASFNTAPNDPATVLITNATVNPNSSTSWVTSTTATGGQTVSVHIYYHNTGTDAAQNAYVRMTPPSAAFTSGSIQGSVSASNANTSAGSASLSFTDGQPHTLTYNAIRWYPDQPSDLSNSPRPLLNGQTGQAIFSGSGLSIGTVPVNEPSGLWTYSQGTVVVDFIVSPAQVQSSCPATALTNQPTNITTTSANFSGSLSPTPSGAYTTWFEYGTTPSFGQSTYQTSGSIQFSGSASGLQQGTTYYVRSVVRSNDTACNNAVIYGNTVQFQTVQVVQSSLVATTQSASGITQTYALLNGTVTGTNVTNVTRWFEYGTTYSLGQTTAQQYGQGQLSAQLYSLSPNTTYYFRTVGRANETGVVYGTILSFQTLGNAVVCPTYVTTDYPSGITQTSASFSGTVNQSTGSYQSWFEYGTTGSFGGQTSTQTSYGTAFSGYANNLISGTTYYVRAVARSTESGCNGVNIYGNTVTFQTIYQQVIQQSSLSVTTTSATNVQYNSASLNGYTYGINASNIAHWFEYGTTYSLGQRTGDQYGQGNFTDSVYNLVPGTTYYFRAAARANETGVSYGSIMTFQTPVQYIQTYQTYVPPVYVPPVLTPSVSTNPATIVTTSSARLNASAVMNNIQSNGWFEYGATPSLGRQTLQLNLGATGSNTYYATVSGLTANTLYYFRAVTQNTQGQIVRGQLLTFTTLTPAPVYVPPVKTQTVVSKPIATVAAATYTPSTSKEVISKTVDDISFPCGTKVYVCARDGHTIQYTITVMNPSWSATSNAVITDTLSPFLDFKSASEDANYNAGTRLVQWSRQLGPREGHTFIIQVFARDIADNVIVKNNAQITIGGKTYKSNDTEVCITITPVKLEVTADKASVSAGDSITYTVRYSNVDGAPVQNLNLRLSVPQGTTMVGSDRAGLTAAGGIVTVPAGGLNPKQSGTVSLTVKVNKEIKKDEVITFTATASYQDMQGVPQQEIVNFVDTPVTDKSTSLQTASVVSTAGFMPNTLLGWLALALLALIVVLILMRLWSEYRTGKGHPPETV